jgi:phosphate starvation-inducible PhoH-like protein
LIEKKVEIKGVNPAEFFGVNNDKFKHIKSFFPDLKIRSRGNHVSFSGDIQMVDLFEDKLKLIVQYLKKFNSITENNIDNLMEDEGKAIISDDQGSGVIVHGNDGIKVRARTLNQQKLVKAVYTNDMVFAVGPAGTGKTYTAVALAVRALKEKEVKRIILTRPAVEAGENLGFLPGDLKEKLDPYMMPLYDALRDMIPAERLKEMLEFGVIEIAPLAFMRGRTLDKAFVILDEAQNATKMQMKMFLTRMGVTAKFIVTGDMSQIDLPRSHQSGLGFAIDILKDTEGLEIIRLNQNDVIRHPLVKKIIDAFDKADEKEKQEQINKKDTNERSPRTK